METLKKVSGVILLIFTLFVVTSAVVSYMYSNQKNLTFHSENCSQSEADPWNPETLGIKETSWENDNMLSVKAYVSTNCADKIIAGRYSIKRNKLALSYYIDDPKMVVANCMCAHQINYKIENIAKSDFDYQLERKVNPLVTLGNSILKIF